MTVLNWKNVHYNLIVGPNHMLTQAGSFRFQASNQSHRTLPESPGAEVRKEAALERGERVGRGQEPGVEVTGQEVAFQKETSHENEEDTSLRCSVAKKIQKKPTKL